MLLFSNYCIQQDRHFVLPQWIASYGKPNAIKIGELLYETIAHPLKEMLHESKVHLLEFQKNKIKTTSQILNYWKS